MIGSASKLPGRADGNPSPGNLLLPRGVGPLAPGRRKGMDAQTSIATSFNYDIPIERQIHLIAEAGLTHLSLGAMFDHSGYLEAGRRRDLRAKIADLGLAMDMSATLTAAAERMSDHLTADGKDLTRGSHKCFLFASR